MRGFPLLNGLLILACLLLFALPLASLTGQRTSRPEPTAPTTDEVQERTDALLALRFAHLPRNVTVHYEDQVLLDLKTVNESLIEADLLLPPFSPDEGIELLIDVTWPEATPETVVEAILEPADLETCSVTVWGEQSLSEVVTFSWHIHHH